MTNRFASSKEFDKWLRSELLVRLKKLAKARPNLNPIEASNIVMEELLNESEKALGIRDIKFDKELMTISFNREH